MPERRRRRVPVPAALERVLDSALDHALAVQHPVVVAYVDRARARRPGATPAQVIDQLGRRYLAAVVGVGAASGGAAAIPGAGTGTAIASGAAEVTAFVSATAMYTLALAQVHDIPTHDPEVRRALVLAVLLGEGATTAIGATAYEAPHWAQVIGRSGSREKIAGINSRLARLLFTRFGTRQGALLIGRALPLGIGAGIGAAGNAAVARASIAAARRAFGPAPAQFSPRVVEGSVIPDATARPLRGELTDRDRMDKPGDGE